jgi:hypothetical protein
VEGWQTIRTKGQCAQHRLIRRDVGLHRKKSEKCLTWRTKSEILLSCFEVGYVSSSFLNGSDPWYPAPPR